VEGELKFLLDTNVFLELLLDQKKASEVEDFFMKVDLLDVSLTDFSLHSIGIVLCSRKRYAAFVRFVEDMLVNAGIRVIHLTAEDMGTVASIAQRFGLDFDDAYQYAVAEKFDLEIISFDSDFDRTDRGRKLPGEIVSHGNKDIR